MDLEQDSEKAVLPEESNFVPGNPLCGIVLAGGEGKRLRPFVHLLRKDLLPKQYVNFIGRRSMLEHTLDRAGKLISSERLFLILNEAHLRFPEVQQQIGKRPPKTIVVQPENKETGPGLLLALMHLSKRYPNSVAAVFPSDHFVLGEEKLMRYVRLAHRVVKNDPSRLLLLGVEPDREESEYGYILPAECANGAREAVPVSGFIEKPDFKTAKELMDRGALWNTMMMVFRTETFLRLVYEVYPDLYLTFQQIYRAIDTPHERDVVREVYRQLQPVNFSKQLLEPYVQAHPGSLLTLPVSDMLWSDWGTESRIMDVLRRTGHAARLNGLSPYRPVIERRMPAEPHATPAKSGSLKHPPFSPVIRPLS
jgi:mannose-1-phosphate guanylyltransferase